VDKNSFVIHRVKNRKRKPFGKQPVMNRRGDFLNGWNTDMLKR
jgi:hypothetical protein